MKKTVDKIIIKNNINLEEVWDELADFISKAKFYSKSGEDLFNMSCILCLALICIVLLPLMFLIKNGEWLVWVWCIVAGLIIIAFMSFTAINSHKTVKRLLKFLEDADSPEKFIEMISLVRHNFLEYKRFSKPHRSIADFNYLESSLRDILCLSDESIINTVVNIKNDMAEFVITKNDSSGDVHTESRYFRYIFNTMTDVIEIEFNTWEYTVCRIPYDDCCLM